MEFVDYTGKCNRHEDYLQVIKQLERKCRYIEYVLVNEEDRTFLERFEGSVISSSWKNKWWGTESSQKSRVYRMNASSGLFQYLKGVETFCRYIVSDQGDFSEETEFGINDIAFFDEKELPLLFTTTHEGYITVREDLFR